MQFSNGCWLQKKGCSAFGPKEAYFVQVEDTAVTICAPTNKIMTRGDVLGGINLTVRITSPASEVIRVQTAHHLGVQDKGPAFVLEQTQELPLVVEESEQFLSVKSGSLELVINKENWSMTYKRDGQLLTSSVGKDLACMKTDFTDIAYDLDGDTANTYMRQCLSLGVNEHVYGLGERFSAFVKNGQSVDIYNEDGGTSTSQGYKNIPFYVTDKGYGVLVNHPEKVSFEVASDYVNKVQFSVEGGKLDYYLISGSSMKEVLGRYTDLTGKPSLPPAWTFGLWLSTSFTTNYDEATVMSFIEGMLDRGIPLRTFHFDCYWMKEFHWTNFLWDERVFPDPEGMLRRIKAKGLNICVWINSYVGQESRLFKEGMEKGYFIKRTNGDVWQWDMWQPGLAIIDFTNPEACRWYQGYLKQLMDMGVDCFKTDFGERIPDRDVVYYDGSDPKKMHNYYTYLYNKTVYDLICREKGKEEAVVFARSATVGGQKFPVHWGGDCWSDYESMEQSLRGGLSLCMSGFGYWAHDIGGFEHTSTADVYKRWLAFGLLSSHSRLHGSQSYRVPWVYDDEAVEVCRVFTRLKASLMPYLYQMATNTSRQGIPMMRSMVLEFTEDRNCAYLDKQYMLGDNLLVAPVFNDQSMASYYLPEGVWTDFFTGEEKEGQKWYEEKVAYTRIPLMVRPGSIVAVSAHDDGPDYDYADELQLRAYRLQEQIPACVTVTNRDHQQVLSGSLMKKNNLIEVDIDADKPYSIRLINVLATGAEGCRIEHDGQDTVVTAIAGNAVIRLA